MKKIYNVIEVVNLNILIFLALIYLFFFRQYSKYKAKKLIKVLNEKGLCMYEIIYILKNGKKYPCNQEKEDYEINRKYANTNT